MRWTPGNRGNVQDVRGGGGGGGMGMPLGIGGVVILLVGSWLTGVNLFDVVGGGGATSKTGSYQPTRAVLFRNSINSACGLSSSATGPFYCPGDRKVYLDLSFFNALHQKLGAPGDFAQAYVLAHEVGHHVQNLTGTLDSQPFSGNANERSVRVELQADCYAGVWGHEAAKPGRADAGKVELEPGDVEEGLNAASAIGDDRLQQKSQGHVSPESFTHGSSAQRVAWFKRGMETGDPRACDTFGDTR
jgi:predicted metalloprotease